MATPVEVPKLGNTVEECIVSRWVKHKGDAVAMGDVVAEIETDKATFEVTAPVGGTVIETFYDEGALAPVYTKLFVIGEAGEKWAGEAPDVVHPASSPTLSEPRASASGLPVMASASVGPPPVGLDPGGTAFSPRARRFAEEHRFYPAAVNGSGPGGRVLEEDLRALYYGERELPARRQAETARPTVSTMSATGQTNACPTKPTSGIRNKIARRMRESLASTAQYTLNASADAAGLLILRARIKASTGVPDININDLVAFCTIRALLDVPSVNAEYIDGQIHLRSEVHLGFACDTPRGLMVPVVRNAHTLSIGDLASSMKALTTQAVKGAISPDDLSGGTFTVSNLGGLGIESFTPLLNPPQVAILGVGAIQVKPVRKQGKLEFIDAIGLSLTCDHQVIDGAPGARFLQIVKEKIENVERLCSI